MIDIKINGVSYISNLLPESLEITPKIKEGEGSFALLLTQNEVVAVDVLSDIKFLMDSKLIYAGLISEIGYEKYGEKIKMNLSFTDYNTFARLRRVTLPQVNSDEIYDKAELIVKAMISQYLAQYGITEGHIESNLSIQDGSFDIDSMDKKAVADWLDELCETVACQWYIDLSKKLYFDKGVPDAVDHTEIINWNRSDFYDISVSRTNEDYRNRQIIKGGEPSDAISEEYLGDDGNIYVVMANQDEIDRLSQLIPGSDGIVEEIEENEKITTLADAQKLAIELLNEFSRPRTTLEFKTSAGSSYKAGDFIHITIPQYNLTNEKFCIDEITISAWQKQYFEYSVKASLRDNNSARKDLYDYLASLQKKQDESDANKAIYTESVGIQIQDRIITSATIIIED